ncbi:proline-rich protein 36 [Amia ocellicauda]|uniref:proline-rich protein 36 n=1 Tax=Amia ocellicauda TaxID=2972642 RepID=UPI003463E710
MQEEASSRFVSAQGPGPGQGPLPVCPTDSPGQPSGPSHPHAASKERLSREEGIRIVSVTSLSQSAAHTDAHRPEAVGQKPGPVGAQSTNQALPGCSVVPNPGGPVPPVPLPRVPPGGGVRRRAHPTPPRNPVLIARKRLLDKALLHKVRVRETVTLGSQQEALFPRRDQPSVPSSPLRKVPAVQCPSALGRLHTAKKSSGGQAAPVDPSRLLHRRGCPPNSSPQPRLQTQTLPRAGCGTSSNLSTAPATLGPGPTGPPCRTNSVNGSSNAAVGRGGPSGRGASRGLQCPGPALGTGISGAIQGQLEGLSGELRTLGRAVRMLAEQQGRVEREQAAQTQIQRQILSTLQALAASLVPAPPPPPPPPSVTSTDSPAPAHAPYTPFNQDTYQPTSHYKLANPTAATCSPRLSPPSPSGYQNSGSGLLGTTQHYYPPVSADSRLLDPPQRPSDSHPDSADSQFNVLKVEIL